MSLWSDLQSWYASNCDGDWEHDFGIKIETMEPGWLVTIDLEDTNLEGKESPHAQQNGLESNLNG